MVSFPGHSGQRCLHIEIHGFSSMVKEIRRLVCCIESFPRCCLRKTAECPSQMYQARYFKQREQEFITRYQATSRLHTKEVSAISDHVS